jgi:hypothetical protein
MAYPESNTVIVMKESAVGLLVSGAQQLPTSLHQIIGAVLEPGCIPVLVMEVG